MRYWLQKEVAMADLARIPRRQLSFPQLAGAGWTGAEVVDEVWVDEEVWKDEEVKVATVVGTKLVEISTTVVRISKVEITVVSTVDAGAVTVVRIFRVDVSTTVVKIPRVDVSTTVVRISRVEIIVVSTVDTGAVTVMIDAEAVTVTVDADWVI